MFSVYFFSLWPTLLRFMNTSSELYPAAIFIFRMAINKNVSSLAASNGTSSYHIHEEPSLIPKVTTHGPDYTTMLFLRIRKVI